jgi:uncharacterized cupin superfamily protein
MTANLFDSEPDFGREGMSARVVGQHAGSELLGATLYELEPGGRQADLHLHHARATTVFRSPRRARRERSRC